MEEEMVEDAAGADADEAQPEDDAARDEATSATDRGGSGDTGYGTIGDVWSLL